MVRILAIDDEKDILFTLKAIGDVAGFAVVTVDNGYEALKLIKKEQFDLVMVDYHMPTLNGLKLVKETRKSDKKVPILVLTVDESVELAREFLEAGATDFAIKPIKAADLISRVKLHLELNEYKESKSLNMVQNKILPKGLSSSTLEIILSFFKKSNKAHSLNSISSGTGLAYQTVHRYLDYLFHENYVDIEMNYGKVGRPVHKYYLKSGINEKTRTE